MIWVLGDDCGASITPIVRAQHSEMPQTHQGTAPGADGRHGGSILFRLSQPGPVS